MKQPPFKIVVELTVDPTTYVDPLVTPQPGRVEGYAEEVFLTLAMGLEFVTEAVVMRQREDGFDAPWYEKDESTKRVR